MSITVGEMKVFGASLKVSKSDVCHLNGIKNANFLQKAREGYVSVFMGRFGRENEPGKVRHCLRKLPLLDYPLTGLWARRDCIEIDVDK